MEEIPGIGPVPVPRPGCVAGSTRGSGPVKIITTFAGAEYVLSGTTVYRDGSSIGTVASGGYYQSAQSESQLVFVSGWNAYLVESGVMTQITDPDLGQVSGVSCLAGIFIYPQRDSSEYVYSTILSAGTIDPLSFANAEKHPDPITRSVCQGDNVWFFGTRSIEPQYKTGDADLPFVRSNGQGYDKGCPSPYSIVAMDNSLLFLATEDEKGPGFFRGAAVPERISTGTIDTMLAACDDLGGITCLSIAFDGHEVYLANIPGRGSVGFDLSTKLWSEWASFGLGNFRLQCGDGGHYGDSTSGQLWTLDASVYTDDGDPIVREGSIWIPVDVPNTNSAMCLIGAYGQGLATGEGSEPVVELRHCEGGLGDWTNWQSANLGVQGDRQARAKWFQQGQITVPGRLVEYRCSDPVLFVPYYLLVGSQAYG